jgi:endonuclease YncB( thermonuclease family)
MSKRDLPTRRGSRTFSLAIALAVAALVIWMRRPGAVDPGPGSGTLHVPAGETAGGFERLVGCRLLPARSNDGDSFRVGHSGGEVTLRLYYVDAPESYLDPQGFNRDRLAHQGRYFGGLAAAETIDVGLEAKSFARRLLTEHPFEVFTAWEPVYDSGRHYGFVRFTGGGPEGRYLSELLVENGLARIYTKGTDTPDGRSRREYQEHLGGLEKSAKAAGAGGWGGGRAG